MGREILQSKCYCHDTNCHPILIYSNILIATESWKLNICWSPTPADGHSPALSSYRLLPTGKPPVNIYIVYVTVNL